jgi:hypothetical protein
MEKEKAPKKNCVANTVTIHYAYKYVFELLLYIFLLHVRA